MAKDVIVTAEKIRKRRRIKKIANISLILLLLLLIIIYIVLKINYSEGSFSVSLKENEDITSGLSLYESLYDRASKRKIYANNIQFMDNISVKWLPSDIDDAKYEGSHNGENYIAFSFFIENTSDQSINYWYSMNIDDVIKNVDEAARVMIYLNGERTIYAKGSSNDREKAETGTELFRNDDDGMIILEQRTGLEPSQIDRFTVVIYLEGDDPDCVDALIGGMLKMHMTITEEHTNETEG